MLAAAAASRRLWRWGWRPRASHCIAVGIELSMYTSMLAHPPKHACRRGSSGCKRLGTGHDGCKRPSTEHEGCTMLGPGSHGCKRPATVGCNTPHWEPSAAIGLARDQKAEKGLARGLQEAWHGNGGLQEAWRGGLQEALRGKGGRARSVALNTTCIEFVSMPERPNTIQYNTSQHHTTQYYTLQGRTDAGSDVKARSWISIFPKSSGTPALQRMA